MTISYEERVGKMWRRATHRLVASTPASCRPRIRGSSPEITKHNKFGPRSEVRLSLFTMSASESQVGETSAQTFCRRTVSKRGSTSLRERPERTAVLIQQRLPRTESLNLPQRLLTVGRQSTRACCRRSHTKARRPCGTSGKMILSRRSRLTEQCESHGRESKQSRCEIVPTSSAGVVDSRLFLVNTIETDCPLAWLRGCSFFGGDRLTINAR